MPKRVLVVANKSWEADPLVSVLLNPKLRPASVIDNWTFTKETLFSTPGTGSRPPGTAPRPRCVCDAGSVSIEVWCIEDWMGTANHSSSKAKIEAALPAIFAAGTAPVAVVAFGTAGFPDLTTANGCPVIGSSAYLFNPYRQPPAGITPPTEIWDDQQKVGTLLLSKGGASLVGQLGNDATARLNIDSRLSPAPTNTAAPPVLLAATNYVALSGINVTNYDDYVWSDRMACEIFRKENPAAPVGSIETTHGLIRLMSEAPFVFVSGITDRLGYFNQELAPKTPAQNFVAAHNAGIAVAWLMPLILKAN